MKKFSAVFLDISGVLYESDVLIPGAIESIKAIRDSALSLRFVTNTATKNSRQIVDDLADKGIVIQTEELFTAPLAARQYITQQGLRPYCLIHTSLFDEFAQITQESPNAVLLGDARDDLNYKSLNRAFQLVKQGVPLIAIGMNKYFSEGGELMLDAGAFVHAIEWAADTQAIVMGKPSQAFFHQVAKDVGCPPEQCLMVGDDVIADVKGAIDAGMQACLVKTGKYRSSDDQLRPELAFKIPSIAELPDLLASGLS